jgi:hypothetical protein
VLAVFVQPFAIHSQLRTNRTDYLFPYSIGDVAVDAARVEYELTGETRVAV